MAIGGSGLAVFWRNRPVKDDDDAAALGNKDEEQNRIDGKLDGLSPS